MTRDRLPGDSSAGPAAVAAGAQGQAAETVVSEGGPRRSKSDVAARSGTAAGSSRISDAFSDSPYAAVGSPAKAASALRDRPSSKGAQVDPWDDKGPILKSQSRTRALATETATLHASATQAVLTREMHVARLAAASRSFTLVHDAVTAAARVGGSQDLRRSVGAVKADVEKAVTTLRVSTVAVVEAIAAWQNSVAEATALALVATPARLGVLASLGVVGAGTDAAALSASLPLQPFPWNGTDYLAATCVDAAHLLATARVPTAEWLGMGPRGAEGNPTLSPLAVIPEAWLFPPEVSAAVWEATAKAWGVTPSLLPFPSTASTRGVTAKDLRRSSGTGRPVAGAVESGAAAEEGVGGGEAGLSPARVRRVHEHLLRVVTQALVGQPQPEPEPEPELEGGIAEEASLSASVVAGQQAYRVQLDALRTKLATPPRGTPAAERRAHYLAMLALGSGVEAAAASIPVASLSMRSVSVGRGWSTLGSPYSRTAVGAPEEEGRKGILAGVDTSLIELEGSIARATTSLQLTRFLDYGTRVWAEGVIAPRRTPRPVSRGADSPRSGRDGSASSSGTQRPVSSAASFCLTPTSSAADVLGLQRTRSMRMGSLRAAEGVPESIVTSSSLDEAEEEAGALTVAELAPPAVVPPTRGPVFVTPLVIPAYDRTAVLAAPAPSPAAPASARAAEAAPVSATPQAPVTPLVIPASARAAEAAAVPATPKVAPASARSSASASAPAEAAVSPRAAATPRGASASVRAAEAAPVPATPRAAAAAPVEAPTPAAPATPALAPATTPPSALASVSVPPPAPVPAHAAFFSLQRLVRCLLARRRVIRLKRLRALVPKAPKLATALTPERVLVLATALRVVSSASAGELQDEPCMAGTGPGTTALRALSALSRGLLLLLAPASWRITGMPHCVGLNPYLEPLQSLSSMCEATSTPADSAYMALPCGHAGVDGSRLDVGAVAHDAGSYTSASPSTHVITTAGVPLRLPPSILADVLGYGGGSWIAGRAQDLTDALVNAGGLLLSPPAALAAAACLASPSLVALPAALALLAKATEKGQAGVDPTELEPGSMAAALLAAVPSPANRKALLVIATWASLTARVLELTATSATAGDTERVHASMAELAARDEEEAKPVRHALVLPPSLAPPQWRTLHLILVSSDVPDSTVSAIAEGLASSAAALGLPPFTSLLDDTVTVGRGTAITSKIVRAAVGGRAAVLVRIAEGAGVQSRAALAAWLSSVRHALDALRLELSFSLLAGGFTSWQVLPPPPAGPPPPVPALSASTPPDPSLCNTTPALLACDSLLLHDHASLTAARVLPPELTAVARAESDREGCELMASALASPAVAECLPPALHAALAAAWGVLPPPPMGGEDAARLEALMDSPVFPPKGKGTRAAALAWGCRLGVGLLPPSAVLETGRIGTASDALSLACAGRAGMIAAAIAQASAPVVAIEGVGMWTARPGAGGAEATAEVPHPLDVTLRAVAGVALHPALASAPPHAHAGIERAAGNGLTLNVGADLSQFSGRALPPAPVLATALLLTALLSSAGGSASARRASDAMLALTSGTPVSGGPAAVITLPVAWELGRRVFLLSPARLSRRLAAALPVLTASASAVLAKLAQWTETLGLDWSSVTSIAGTCPATYPPYTAMAPGEGAAACLVGGSVTVTLLAHWCTAVVGHLAAVASQGGVAEPLPGLRATIHVGTDEGWAGAAAHAPHVVKTQKKVSRSSRDEEHPLNDGEWLDVAVAAATEMGGAGVAALLRSHEESGLQAIAIGHAAALGQIQALLLRPSALGPPVDIRMPVRTRGSHAGAGGAHAHHWVPTTVQLYRSAWEKGGLLVLAAAVCAEVQRAPEDGSATPAPTLASAVQAAAAALSPSSSDWLRFGGGAYVVPRWMALPPNTITVGQLLQAAEATGSPELAARMEGALCIVVPAGVNARPFVQHGGVLAVHR